MEEAIAATIAELRQNVRNGKIQLINNSYLSLQDCPTEYQPFMKGLMALTLPNDTSNADIIRMAKMVTRLQAFKVTIQMVYNFVDDMFSGHSPFKPKRLPSSATSPRIEIGKIRDYFYPELSLQMLVSIQQGWINSQDIEAQESYIFIAYPALAILEALEQSRHITNGIQLAGDVALTGNSFPENSNMNEFLTSVLAIKENFDKLNIDQTTYLRLKILNASIPEELKRHEDEQDIHACLSCLTGTAIEITRKRFFQEQLSSILDECQQMLESGTLVNTPIEARLQFLLAGNPSLASRAKP